VGLNWLPENWNIVINPRGFRPGSVRNDTFFQSIPLILRQFPNTLFLCCSMAGQPEADAWLDELQIHRNTMLLPTIPQELLWSLFSRAQVTVSISEHDGTPNSLLEAMTCGCFPVAGDIESIREWITPGVNGLLVDPNNPEQLASAVISALLNEKLRSDAAEINRQIILERADSEIVRTEIEVFYNQFVSD
jgi:glycosyltransferase involved in cell wall biosynthesis